MEARHSETGATRSSHHHHQAEKVKGEGSQGPDWTAKEGGREGRGSDRQPSACGRRSAIVVSNRRERERSPEDSSWDRFMFYTMNNCRHHDD